MNKLRALFSDDWSGRACLWVLVGLKNGPGLPRVWPLEQLYWSMAQSRAHMRLQVHPPLAPYLVHLVFLSKQDFLDKGSRFTLWHEPQSRCAGGSEGVAPGMPVACWQG